jgi:LysM repeat protein
MRIKDEINLASNKPNITDLLWYVIEVRGLDLRPEEGTVKSKGELSVFVLYAGDDEGNPLQWMEYTLPFSGEVECTGCTEELIPNIEASIMHRGIEVKPDADGEERILAVDVVLELDMKLYREEAHDIILDVYTPLKECILHGKQELLESLLIRNFSKCRVSDRIEVKETQGKILQICHSQGRVKVDKKKVVENGIQVDGIVFMKILYIIGNDEMPFYSMEAMIPFTHVVEVRGIKQDSKYYVRAELEQLSTTMADSNEIEVKATVGINVLVMNGQEELIIDKVEEKPLDMKKIQSMPGITVYMVKPKDTLWDIAKRFYTTVDEICSLNELSDENIHPCQPLLLVKKVES